MLLSLSLMYRNLLVFSLPLQLGKIILIPRIEVVSTPGRVGSFVTSHFMLDLISEGRENGIGNFSLPQAMAKTQHLRR